MRQELTAARLRELLHYDPETGVFTWRRNIKGGARAGHRAGADHGIGSGYRRVGLDGTSHFEHRLAWLYMTGEWPPVFIDHINGCRSDNRMANLRLADHSQNQQNAKNRTGTTSGVRGVYWHRQRQRWHAEISLNGVKRSLGLHATLEQAARARMEAQKRLHPFARQAQ